MPSATEVRQAMEDEATGMDLDTVVHEVTASRENGNMNPMASPFLLLAIGTAQASCLEVSPPYCCPP